MVLGKNERRRFVGLRLPKFPAIGFENDGEDETVTKVVCDELANCPLDPWMRLLRLFLFGLHDLLLGDGVVGVVEGLIVLHFEVEGLPPFSHVLVLIP